MLSPGRYDELINFPWHHSLILHEAGVPPIHTPMSTLLALPEDVKTRVRLVHVADSAVPEGQGLFKAKAGVENTLVLDVARPAYSDALEMLDLVSSIDLFSSLDISHGREVLQITKSQTVEAGDPVFLKGDAGDAFFIIASGCAEVRIPKSSMGGGGSSGRSLGRKDEGEDDGKAGDAGEADEGGEAGEAGEGKKAGVKAGIRRGSALDQAVVKTYMTGDYFGEQSILTGKVRRTNEG